MVANAEKPSCGRMAGCIILACNRTVFNADECAIDDGHCAVDANVLVESLYLYMQTIRTYDRIDDMIAINGNDIGAIAFNLMAIGYV